MAAAHYSVGRARTIYKFVGDPRRNMDGGMMTPKPKRPIKLHFIGGGGTRELPDMMSASKVEGGRGKADVVREVA